MKVGYSKNSRKSSFIKKNKPIAKESVEQKALIRWCDLIGGYPYNLIYHIPNGGSRHLFEAVNLKKEGVVSGIPDLFLPVAAKGFHGLYIEMKIKKNSSKLTENQLKWGMLLTKQGYLVMVCYSWIEAAKLLVEYVGIKRNIPEK